MKDYIVIEPPPERNPGYAYPKFEKREPKKFEVFINSADTSDFIALPGIGSKLAGRIILFREKLGGFYSVEQVSETFGLADSVFQKIRPFLHLDGEVKKISINSITIDQLKQHPYFRYKLANAIIAYRNQHGPFQSLEELKRISLVEDKTFDKIIYYIEL